MSNITYIRPQEGYQQQFLSSPADIVIGGGAAGAGKTYSLLLEPLHYITRVDGFGGVIFRRTSPQIKGEGGLWDTSVSIYSALSNAVQRESSLEWVFTTPKGTKNRIKFNHLEYEKNKLDWQGTQIPFIGFDELTHFTESMFFYLLTRNRSVCGVKPYIRATCNPDPDSWVARLIEWWIDQEEKLPNGNSNPNFGFPIQERSGVIRYFVRSGEDYYWSETKEGCYQAAKHIIDPFLEKTGDTGLTKDDFIKSITFVSGSIYQNKKLLEVNPAYLANLASQDEQTRAQLLEGNWKVVISENDIYSYSDLVGALENKYTNDSGETYITADIALQGSNKFVVGVWKGQTLVDIHIMLKSNGKEVLEAITDLAKKYRVPNRNIAFDADGVGGYLDGFLQGAQSFNGGAKVIEVKDETTGRVIKENYFNLKAQVFYRSGAAVSRGEYSISQEVAAKMFDEKMTVRQRFMFERSAIKRDKVDQDGKLKLIPKEEMKVKLNGESPDLFDMFAMREFFNLKVKRKWLVG